ncbi:MAG: peptide deformylase [Parachlamydiaceae bacterium]|nr:peptide deformylase [Parachlamydiaceae bacterium]
MLKCHLIKKNKGKKMKLPIAYYGHPILRKKAALIGTISHEIQHLVKDMIETMITSKGVGLAAPQVHHSLSLFIACLIEEDDEEEIEQSKIRVFINPKILDFSHEQWTQSEGCLSIPRIFRDVDRPISIKITALDLSGHAFTEEFQGYSARVILHEMDHLHGVLFIDRLPSKQRKALEIQLRAIKKKFHSSTISADMGRLVTFE